MYDNVTFLDRTNNAIARALISVDEEEKPSDSPMPPGTCAVPTPVEQVVRCLLTWAIETDISEVCLVPDENQLIVRFSTRSATRDVATIPGRLQPALTRSVRKMADIAGDELQGIIPVHFKDQSRAVKIAYVPTQYGEAITLRF